MTHLDLARHGARLPCRAHDLLTRQLARLIVTGWGRWLSKGRIAESLEPSFVDGCQYFHSIDGFGRFL
jgi:hypothetical protein